MKKMNLKMATLAAATAVFFIACKDDVIVPTANPNAYNVSVNGNVVTVKNLAADTVLGIGATGPYSAGKFSYFNLATNQIVVNADTSNNNWDLAFGGTTIKVNCGTSGPGNGGAFVYTGTFDAFTQVPTDSTFRTDNAASYAITKGSGKGWYNYDGPNNIVSAIPGRVLVIRTATRKYAKVEILHYYKGNVTPSTTASDSIKAFDSRYYSFRYTYQANGSTTF